MEKALLFLATEKGYRSLKELIDRGLSETAGCVVSFPETNVIHDWSGDIRSLCGQNGIPFFLWSDVKQDLTGLACRHSATCAFAISWKYLIGLEINRVLKRRLIVFHDSLLPRYRGFTPTATAIINGDDTVGVTALFAVDEVDRGDIIAQKTLAVPRTMYMKEIVSAQADLYAEMLCELLTSPDLTAVPQDESLATYSIWRNPEDCEIDWSRSSEEIYNFVRALGDPYPGAYTWYEGQKLILDRTEPVRDLPFEIRQSGKIWSLEDGMPVVICGRGMLRITAARNEAGGTFRFGKLRVRLGLR